MHIVAKGSGFVREKIFHGVGMANQQKRVHQQTAYNIYGAVVVNVYIPVPTSFLIIET